MEPLQGPILEPYAPGGIDGNLPMFTVQCPKFNVYSFAKTDSQILFVCCFSWPAAMVRYFALRRTGEELKQVVAIIICTSTKVNCKI